MYVMMFQLVHQVELMHLHIHKPCSCTRTPASAQLPIATLRHNYITVIRPGWNLLVLLFYLRSPPPWHAANDVKHGQSTTVCLKDRIWTDAREKNVLQFQIYILCINKRWRNCSWRRKGIDPCCHSERIQWKTTQKDMNVHTHKHTKQQGGC